MNPLKYDESRRTSTSRLKIVHANISHDNIFHFTVYEKNCYKPSDDANEFLEWFFPSVHFDDLNSTDDLRH